MFYLYSAPLNVELESTTLDEHIKCASKWFIFAFKKTKESGVGLKSQVCNLHMPHLLVLEHFVYYM